MKLEEGMLFTHNFGCKTFSRPRSCDFCKQMLHNTGIYCTDCHYTCHQECHLKVITPCECSSKTSLLSSLSPEYRPQKQQEESFFKMDVTYLTERIILLYFPETGSNTTHASNLKDVGHMLNTKHGNNYMVFNLSERKHDLTQFKAQVLEFGWPPNLAPPLQRLCSICKAMDTWIISDPRAVVVLHSKGDKGRIGTVVSAYLHYITICSPNEQVIDKLTIKQFHMEKLSPYMHPSQKRYVHYFAGLLSGAIKMNNSSIFLHRIIINGVPNFDSGGCRPFFKIYQGMQHIYTTRVFSISQRSRQIAINLDTSLQLHGDIMIKCYHSILQPAGRTVIFRVQFHTCTLDKDYLVFNKEELDDASFDYRFPNDGRVELQFSQHPIFERKSDPTPDMMTPVDGTLVTWDSYENFNLGPETNLQLSPPIIKKEMQLDELLDDMIREIHSISDLKTPSEPQPFSNIAKHSDPIPDYGHPQMKQIPTAVISVNGNKQILSSSPTWTKEKPKTYDNEEDKPYHTRKNCAPFTYGVTPGSPVLQRKYLRSTSPTVDEILPKDVLEDQYFITEEKRDPNSQNWLQKQQEKLKARKEGKVWEDRQQREQQLMAELRSAHHKKSPEPNIPKLDFERSHKEESPIKAVNYSTPLHVNTYNGQAYTPPPPSSHPTSKPPICRGSSAPSSPLLPSRSSSRDVTRNRYQQWQTSNYPLSRQKSDISYDRERPFASMKKAHQLAKEQIANNKVPPHQYISSSPVYGNISGPQNRIFETNTLLTLSEEPKVTTSPEPSSISPTSSKLDELEQSLLALTSSSPPHSPVQPVQQDQISPVQIQSTPAKSTPISNNVSSWSVSAIGTSPSGSPRTGDRPPTPSFPVHPGTPYVNHESHTGAGLPPRSPSLPRKERTPSPATVQGLNQSMPNISHSTNDRASPYFDQSQRSSMLSLGEPSEVIHHHPLFVKDTSKFWYKSNISREEAISMLKDKPPGTFVVRDSNSFPGAFGLALKVATPPPNVQNTTGDISNELVRHFLIEPTSKGVRLKGCANEPVFGSLSALVYQHSMTPMALPCKLILPESDPAGEIEEAKTTEEPNSSPLVQGAACNLLYLGTADVELLTGSAAIERALTEIFDTKPIPKAGIIHFKVSGQGITLTDNSHKLFFRRHYPLATISHCGLDPKNRRWNQVDEENNINISNSHCFGFIAKRPGSKTDNQCHLLAELEQEQPASAILNFVHKVMINKGQVNKSNMI